jgi:DNA-binding winged helix-turn-helix (wHTH) protein
MGISPRHRMKQFHSFRLDTRNQCLWDRESRMDLAPKAFDVLCYLVEHAGRLSTQNELLEALWPETYVNPEVVRRYILDIRRALGDRPDKPVYIKTFPKRGYQFVAPVSEYTQAVPDVATEMPKGIVGRGPVLAELNCYLRKTVTGQRQVVFVTGEAGIGKTALVDTFYQQAVGQSELRIVRGQCVEGFGGKEPYYPMLEALGQLVRGASGRSVLDILARQAPTWLIQLPSFVTSEQKAARIRRPSEQPAKGCCGKSAKRWKPSRRKAP